MFTLKPVWVFDTQILDLGVGQAEAKRMAERLQGLAAYDQGEHGRALELWGQTLQVLRATFSFDVSRLAFSGLV